MKKSEYDLALYSKKVLSVKKRNLREPSQREIESEILCPVPFELCCVCRL